MEDQELDENFRAAIRELQEMQAKGAPLTLIEQFKTWLLTQGGGDGVLTLIVWPTHVGVATDAGEPGTSPDYERGVVHWGPNADATVAPVGDIIGRARIDVPAGEYFYWVYFHAPLGGRHCTVVPMEHPLRMPTSGVIDLYPIANGDQLGALQDD